MNHVKWHMSIGKQTKNDAFNNVRVLFSHISRTIKNIVYLDKTEELVVSTEQR